MQTIGIIGLGKMGQTITSILGNEISILGNEMNTRFHSFYRLSPDTQTLLTTCDVVIEFTTPEAAPGIIKHCIESGVSIVSGSTGWQENHLHSIINDCEKRKGKFFYASNFSIGMNITFALNRRFAMIMNQYPQFNVSIKEIHHLHKKDSPSGTARTLIEDIIDQHKRYTGFDMNKNIPAGENSILPVDAIREGEVMGYHEVTWASVSEKITLSHEVFDRRIFAEGAIMAAHWLIDQPSGVYTMRDIINL